MTRLLAGSRAARSGRVGRSLRGMGSGIVAWTALLCSSWQVFVTTSVPLYLNNQEELQYDLSVIVPFFGAAILVPTLLLPVYVVARRSRLLAIVVWLYLFAGFLFLGVVAIHVWEAGYLAKLAAAAALVAAYALAQYISYRRWDIRRASAYFALFAAGFVAVDTAGFLSRYVGPPQELEVVRAAAEPERGADGPSGPNLYHIVFDEYQTDMFKASLDASVRDSLGGFVFFDDAMTVFGRTRMSLASVFSGRSYDFSSSQMEYQRSALAGSGSMITQLTAAGYRSEAYLHKGLFASEVPFDLVRYHRAPMSDGRIVRRAAFIDLWAFAHLPAFVSARLMEQDSFDNLEAQNAINPAAPIKSLHTFRFILRREPTQQETGRYVLAHLILPHFPNVLRSDCTYSHDGSQTGPVEQAGCANELMVSLVATLKESGRFRESMIIFQSDHGSRYAVSDGILRRARGMRDYSDEWNTARARSLLLIKPPGSDSTEPFTTSSVAASLLDVYPTVAAALGLDRTSAEGVDLFDPIALDGLMQRQRRYYFFEKKGPFGWTDEMVRFRVANGGVSRDGVEVLVNNPPP